MKYYVTLTFTVLQSFLAVGTIDLLWKNTTTTMTKLKYTPTAETVSDAEVETNKRLMDAAHVNTALSVSKHRCVSAARKICMML